jgi:hypothetical protein
MTCDEKWILTTANIPHSGFTAIEYFTHHAFLALHENHIRNRPGKPLGNGIRDRGIKQQILLGGKKTLNEALRQTLGLEVSTLTVRSSIELRKTSDRVLWSSQPPPKRKKRLPVVYIPTLWEHQQLLKVLPAQTRRRSANPRTMLKCHLRDRSQMPQAHPPWKGLNGNIPTIYEYLYIFLT